MAQARALGAPDTEFEPLTRVMAAYGRRLGGAELAASLARWNEFARIYGPVIAGFARNAGVPPQEIDDVLDFT